MAGSGGRGKLKESGTCRVFVSSPFGGFEEEREELVLKLFPKLSHLCQSKGLQLATVDMRWGITEEASSDAQTVNICLREVDRSDIFVGLYGQRYGWHGEKDDVLQKNITNALRQYPWLAKVKDRSVTEMEIIHGHLNKPGGTPAIFAFRNKAYDDAQKVKAEQTKDTRTALKFTAESADTAKKIQELKERVIKTKAQCVALQESYGTPQEGAEFVYKQLKTLLEKTYLSSAAKLTKREESLALHEAYMAGRTAVFVGGEINTKALNLAMQKGQQVVIVGQPGSGKAALLSHWLCGLRSKKSPAKQIIHFVGCSSDSSGVSELMVRLTEELQQVTGHMTKSRTEQLSEGGEDMKPQSTDVSELCRQFQAALTKAAAKHKIILAIDGLGKLQQVSRTAKELFWLPSDIPKNVTVVVTCREGDKAELDELSGRGYTSLQVNPLEQSRRQDMCKELLKQNSKELSSAQMKKIVDSGQTGSPLYLKTVISELCAFGKFRELNEKIDELIACKSVKELFQIFIRRLESDYISDAKRGNIIEQVLCSLRVSRKGLSEHELMSMHNLSSHEWSPLFFAMQHVLVSNAGLLTFGFTELGEAVDSKYLQDKNTKIKYQRILARYFQDELKDKDECIQLNDKTVKRPAEELPWLLLDLGDMAGLITVISDLAIFGRLFLDQEFELIQLWRKTGLNGEQIADHYLAVVKAKAQDIAKRAEQKAELGDIIRLTLVSYLMALGFFMEMAHFQIGQEKILMVQLQLMTSQKPKMGSEFLERNLAAVQNKLAHLYTDTGRLEQARDLHLEVLAKRESFVKEAKTPEARNSALKSVGASYHGIAMLYSKLGHVEEAIRYYEKALEFQKDSEDDAEVADTLHNIGVMQMKLGKYKEALQLCTKSFKIYESLYFANMPPAMAVMLGNIAVCHRNLGQIEQAEAMYLKSIEISEKSVGRQHPHVALGLMNIGTLEINRKQFQKAEVYFRESVDIFQKSDTSNTNADYLRCLEKFIYCLVNLDEKKEAITNFKTLYPLAVAAPGGLKSAWPPVYVEMLEILMNASLVKLAHDVALAMLSAECGQGMDKCLIQYHAACKTLKTPVKPEYNLEKALEKSPGSITLLRHYIDSDLIPAGNIAQLLTTLDKADADRKIGADLYGSAATWCRSADAQAMKIAVLEHAVKKFPNELNFVCSLANEFYDSKEWSKSLVYCRKLVLLEPTNANHRLMLGDLIIRDEQFTEAKKVFKDMIAAFPNNQQVVTHGKKALEMLEQREKQAKPGK